MNLILDMARGIAALGVFLFHISDGLQASMPAVASVFRFGSLGDVLGKLFPSVSLGFATICALVLWFGQPIGRALEAAKHGGLRWLIKAAAFLGVISYSVYLLHGKLFELPAMLVRQLVPMTHPLNAFLTVLGTLALCAVFYLYCERPFLSKKLQKLNENALGN